MEEVRVTYCSDTGGTTRYPNDLMVSDLWLGSPCRFETALVVQY